MADLQTSQTPPPQPDRRPALLHLWSLADHIAVGFFTPVFTAENMDPLPWNFSGLTHKVWKNTSSSHARPPHITYYVSLGPLTPQDKYLVVYVLSPKENDIQANRAAFKRCLEDLINDPLRLMSERYA